MNAVGFAVDRAISRRPDGSSGSSSKMLKRRVLERLEALAPASRQRQSRHPQRQFDGFGLAGGDGDGLLRANEAKLSTHDVSPAGNECCSFRGLEHGDGRLLGSATHAADGDDGIVEGMGDRGALGCATILAAPSTSVTDIGLSPLATVWRADVSAVSHLHGIAPGSDGDDGAGCPAIKEARSVVGGNGPMQGSVERRGVGCKQGSEMQRGRAAGRNRRWWHERAWLRSARHGGLPGAAVQPRHMCSASSIRPTTWSAFCALKCLPPVNCGTQAILAMSSAFAPMPTTCTVTCAARSSAAAAHTSAWQLSASSWISSRLRAPASRGRTCRLAQGKRQGAAAPAG